MIVLFSEKIQKIIKRKHPNYTCAIVKMDKKSGNLILINKGKLKVNELETLYQ